MTRRDRLYVAVLLIALVVGWPLLQGKLPSGHDAGEYQVRLAEFERALRDGNLLPAWAPDVDYGYGSPIFVFLPPLIYDIAIIPRLLGADLINALNLAGLIIIVLSALGMHGLTRHFYGPEGGLLSAVAYLFAPFFLVTLYVRQAFTDFSAYAVLPFCFWFLTQLMARARRRDWILSALSIALLLLSSYSISLMALPALAAYGLLYSALRRDALGGLKCLLAMGLGVTLSAFAWLPTALERNLVHAERLLQGERYFYANHFVYPLQLLSSPWGYGISQPGPNDGFSLALGSAHLLLATAGMALMLRRPASAKTRIFTTAMLVTLICACALSLEISRPVWDSFSALPYLQFPWRFLSLAAFALSALCGNCATALQSQQHRGILAALCIVLIVIEGLPHAQPETLYAVSATEFTPQGIAARSLRATDADEYQPIQVTAAPTQPAPSQIESISGAAAFQQTQSRSQQSQWRVDARSDTRARIHIFYYAGWSAYLDDTPIAIEVEAATGLMLITIPPGQHTLLLRFEDSPIRLTAKMISLLGLIGLVLSAWLWPRVEPD